MFGLVGVTCGDELRGNTSGREDSFLDPNNPDLDPGGGTKCKKEPKGLGRIPNSH